MALISASPPRPSSLPKPMIPTLVEVPGMSINGLQDAVALALPTVPQVCVPETLS